MTAERYVWVPGETPIFTRLIGQYAMGFEQNIRLWSAWESAMYYKYASSDMCYCGMDMDMHTVLDNHSPVEKMYF